MILFHAGFHKTGTTSIQAALGKTSRRRKARFSLIGFGSEAISFKKLGETLELTCRHDSRPTVVSEERLLGNYKTGYQRIGEFSNWARSSVGIHRLRIVVCVRPHTEWYESAFAQLVSAGWGITAIASWISESIANRRHSWASLVSQIDESLDGSVVDVIPMSSSDDVIPRFSEYLEGIGFGKLSSPKARLNSQPEFAMIVLQALLNELESEEAAQSTREKRLPAKVLERLTEFGLEDNLAGEISDFAVREWAELVARLTARPGSLGSAREVFYAMGASRLEQNTELPFAQLSQVVSELIEHKGYSSRLLTLLEKKRRQSQMRFPGAP